MLTELAILLPRGWHPTISLNHLRTASRIYCVSHESHVNTFHTKGGWPSSLLLVRSLSLARTACRAKDTLIAVWHLQNEIPLNTNHLDTRVFRTRQKQLSNNMRLVWRARLPVNPLYIYSADTTAFVILLRARSAKRSRFNVPWPPCES